MISAIQFGQVRFVDKQAEEERARVLSEIAAAKRARIGDTDSVTVLRTLRGYPD